MSLQEMEKQLIASVLQHTAGNRTRPAEILGISREGLRTKLQWKKNLPPLQIARATIRRGAEIFAFGLLFRLQEYIIALGLSAVERSVARGCAQYDRGVSGQVACIFYGTT
jgi:regulatory Fis family protein